jgi:hypothetical protein
MAALNHNAVGCAITYDAMYSCGDYLRLMKHGLLSSGFLAALVVASGLLHGNGAEPGRPGPLVGKTAPSFHVQGIYGESYSLETFKGHILVLQFGSSW